MGDMTPPTPSISRSPGPSIAGDGVAAEFHYGGEIDALALPLRRQVGRKRRAEAPGRNAIEFGPPKIAAERRQQPAGVALRAC